MPDLIGFQGKIDMVAIDVDDTLITPQLTISPRVKAAIGQAVAKGVTVTLATGRMYCSTLPFARELGLNLPLITYQGAYVRDSGSGNILLQHPVPNSLAKEVLQFLNEQGLHANIYLDDRLYVEKLSREAMEYSTLAKIPLYVNGDHIDTLGTGEPIKILAVGKPEKLVSLLETCSQKWGEHLYITRSKPFYLEFMNRKAGKGSAIAYLADRLGICSERVMAIGDTYNDLDMLKWAGLGVAMANGPEDVKQQAKWVTVSNSEDGVAVALERFVL